MSKRVIALMIASPEINPQRDLKKQLGAFPYVDTVRQAGIVKDGWFQIVESKPNIVIVDLESLDETVWLLLGWLKRSWQKTICCVLSNSSLHRRRARALGIEIVINANVPKAAFFKEIGMYGPAFGIYRETPLALASV